MQNKGIVKFIAIALVLVCCFYLSFSFVTRHYESKIANIAATQGDEAAQAFQDSVETNKVWLWTWNLKECREMEMGLGLDLKGGLNVIMEVSVPDIVDMLAAHKQDAVNMGNSPELVDELCAWLSQQGYTLHSKWPKGDLNPYGQFFTGNSYLADMGDGLFNVTFEPRCRNNWHVHHKQVQVLICVAGRGWYQEWGKEAVEMTPGTVIAIPAEVKHWHGAARDSWFQHLTYHKDVQEGASNEWLEPVTDEIYNQLK